jgi:hypothetical protein
MQISARLTSMNTTGTYKWLNTRRRKRAIFT